MVYMYILDKEDYDKIDFEDLDIKVEALHDNYTIYQDLLKIHSNIQLEIDNTDIYSALQILANDRELNDNNLTFYKKIVDKYTNYSDIDVKIEAKNNNKYISFYSYTMPVYIKNGKKSELLNKLNIFKSNHYYYGNTKTTGQMLKDEGVPYESTEGLHYGDVEIKLKLENKVVSDRDLTSYLPLKNENNYYYYNGLEDMKNITRIENNNLPRHKLLKKDKLLQSDILKDHHLPYNIDNYNQLLANNELVFVDANDLKKQSQKFYTLAQKKEKKIFDDLDRAICFLLTFSLQEEKALLVSEKDQWIVYYQELPAKMENFNCRQVLLDRLKDKNFSTDYLEELPLSVLANLFIYQGQLFVSDNNNPKFLDQQGNNLPLHIVINHGQHHHNYYDNGIWPSLLKEENFKKVLPEELIDFHFITIDNQDHVEVRAYYNGQDKIIDEHFYLPSSYQEMINNKLKKLFMLGLMTSSFSIVRWDKEKLFDIREVFMPLWIKNVKVNKEKELFKYLLQF